MFIEMPQFNETSPVLKNSSCAPVNAPYSDFINKFMGAVGSVTPMKKSKCEGEFRTLVWHRNNLSNTKKRKTTFSVQRVKL